MAVCGQSFPLTTAQCSFETAVEKHFEHEEEKQCSNMKLVHSEKKILERGCTTYLIACWSLSQPAMPRDHR
jgi:hypothetical protein